MNHYPMTKEQRESLDQQLATIMERLGEIAILLNACYGDRDQRVDRAQAAQAAVQRLLWALERERGQLGASARDGGSGCERQSSVAAVFGVQRGQVDRRFDIPDESEGKVNYQ